jgi:3',5'-cyclic AMP phosphodiesterase CpdA
MLIAQITDIHLGFDPDNPAEFNRKRLDQVVRAICDMDRKPDLLFATGDLVDRGDVDSYLRLRRALAIVPCPLWLCVGNHDVPREFPRSVP